MPSMASLILQAVAIAASSVGWAVYRCSSAAAAAAHARSEASSSDLLMRAAAAATARSPALSGSVHRPPVAARHPRSGLDNRSGSTVAKLPPSFFDPGREVFEADEKDLESDEALWNLYERWCKFFNEERSWAEMARRFSTFKETVLLVEENKKSDLLYRIGINQFADGKLSELYSKAYTPYHHRSVPYSTSPVYGKVPDFLNFEGDPPEGTYSTSPVYARVPDFVLKGDPEGLGQVAGATEASNPSA